MAQGQLSSIPPLTNGPSLGLSKDELHKIQQYEKILQFRDAIFAGSHPKIKVPNPPAAQTSATAVASPSDAFTPAGDTTEGTNLGHHGETLPPLTSSTQQCASLPGLGNPLPATTNLPTRSFVGAGNMEINPIFLQKSDDLIKAEIQLQRQRLERALRDEVDQRRASMKALAQSEPLADFDLSDVLSKALTLVRATASSSINGLTAAANITATSDSFDDNSYYSSQHNSPDSSLHSPRSGNDANATAQAYKQPAAKGPPEGQAHVQAKQNAQASLPSSLSHASATHQPQGQASNSATSQTRVVTGRAGVAHEYSRHPSVGTTQRMEGINNAEASTSRGGSGNASRSEDSGIIDIGDGADRLIPAVGQEQHGESMLAPQPSPLIQVRVPSINPLAHQPSHVSPLVARYAAVEAQDVSVPQRATAQVAATSRNVRTTISSSDSSPPQGGQSGEKRKGKKKKNNTNNTNNTITNNNNNNNNASGKRPARQAPDELYIKPEPRSPSPMSAPTFIRPHKRLRRQADEEARYTQSERQLTQTYRYDGAEPAYEPREYRPRPLSQVMSTGDYVYRREYVEEPGVQRGVEYVRQVHSPGVYAVNTAPGEIYTTSPAVSVDRYGREPPRYYRDGYEITRTSARPMADRARSRSPTTRERISPLMGPPKAPPSRIVIDPITGRQYYEPASIVRQSVAPPPPRSGELEIVYERAPPRAESRRPGPEPRDDDVLYQRTSPVCSAPRRVVTQPEYVVPDFQRVYRQREYSTRPVGNPHDEYMPLRGGFDQPRANGEHPREYIMRANTALPADAVRYELPREYGRVQSVMPGQSSMQDYPSVPMHPDARREVIQPSSQSYSMRPAEPPVIHRSYSLRPGAQHYHGPPVSARGEPEVPFIERPRVAAQEIYYADEAPRPVYR